MSQRTRSINTHTALGVCAAVALKEECGGVREEGVAATPRSEAVGSQDSLCAGRGLADPSRREWDVPGDKGLVLMAWN